MAFEDMDTDTEGTEGQEYEVEEQAPPPESSATGLSSLSPGYWVA